MSKKQFIVPIPMLKPEDLREVNYSADFNKDFVFTPASFPAIAMIEMYLEKGDEYEIITVRTADDNDRTKGNYEKFKQELKKLSEIKGMDIAITKEILVPHEETKKKHIEFFRALCDIYQPLSDVYMDITYGTKVTSISMFASLVYAENVTKCYISDIVYGKYTHGGEKEGRLFSIRCLYELKELINSASVMGDADIDELLDIFGGIQDGV